MRDSAFMVLLEEIPMPLAIRPVGAALQDFINSFSIQVKANSVAICVILEDRLFAIVDVVGGVIVAIKCALHTATQCIVNEPIIVSPNLYADQLFVIEVIAKGIAVTISIIDGSQPVHCAIRTIVAVAFVSQRAVVPSHIQISHAIEDVPGIDLLHSIADIVTLTLIRCRIVVV